MKKSLPPADHKQHKGTLLASPFVNIDPHPDARKGILTRRTYRAFKEQPVPADIRSTILEAARWAPVPEDYHPVRFIVLDDPKVKTRLYRLTRESKDISNHWESLFKPSGLRGYIQNWLNTPFCVAVCAHAGTGPQHIHNTWNHHLAAAGTIENLALAARYHGLALVVYSHFSQEKLKQLLDVPFDWDVVGVMAMGFPDLRRINPEVLEVSLTRLPLSQLVSSEQYGEPAPNDLLVDRDADALMPDLMTALMGRRTVIRFAPRRVPTEFVFEILRAAQWAPSAGNFQPVRYVVLRDPKRRAYLQGLAEESVAISAHWFPRYQDGFTEHPDWTRVPLAVASIADPTKGGPHIHGEATHIHAGGLAAQNMRVMAHALGLGATLVTHWIEEKVKVFINCPRTWDLVGVMAFGFPTDVPTWERRPLEELVFQDGFGRPWDRTREYPFRLSMTDSED